MIAPWPYTTQKTILIEIVRSDIKLLPLLFSPCQSLTDKEVTEISQVVRGGAKTKRQKVCGQVFCGLFIRTNRFSS